MSKITIVLLVILAVLLIALVVLYFLGKKAQKKQAEQEEMIAAAAQQVNILIIDKGKMKLKDAGFPSVVLENTPKYLRRSKVPVVKAKVGPKIMTLMCDASIYDLIPVKKEVKANGLKGEIKIYLNAEQRAAFFAVSESLDYFEIAQSRNIEAHEIEFRIERYRRYVFKIVALNFGEIFERRSECRNRRARLVEFKLGE